MNDKDKREVQGKPDPEKGERFGRSDWGWQQLLSAIEKPGEPGRAATWEGLRPLFDPEFELPKSAKKVGRLFLSICYHLVQYTDSYVSAYYHANGQQREIARLGAAERFSAKAFERIENNIAELQASVTGLKHELDETAASHHRLISELQKSADRAVNMIAEVRMNALGGGNFGNWAAGLKASILEETSNVVDSRITNALAVDSAAEDAAGRDSRIDALSTEVGEIGSVVAELATRVRNLSFISAATVSELAGSVPGFENYVERRFNDMLAHATEAKTESKKDEAAAPVVQLEKVSDVGDDELKRVRAEAERQAQKLAASPDAVMAAIRRQNAATAGPLPPDAMPEGVSAAGLFQQALSGSPDADEAGKKLVDLVRPGYAASKVEKVNRPSSGADFADMRPRWAVTGEPLETFPNFNPTLYGKTGAPDPTRRIEAVREKADQDAFPGATYSALRCNGCGRGVSMLFERLCEECYHAGRTEPQKGTGP